MGFRRVLCLATLLCHGVIGSPPGWSESSAQKAMQQSAAPRKLHGRFLHITDLHPDEFYKVHSSTEEAVACHRGKGAAGTYGAETSDCDSPLSLMNATFDWIAANLKDNIDFVVWTGDSARHDSDEQIPRSPAQVLGTNRLIADKFADMLSDPTGLGLTIPVIPTLGNNDILPHNILLPGPNKWLQYYTDIWRRFIPEEQRHGFEFGGWFYVEVIPNKLAVFSLNTLYFFDRNAGVYDCLQPSEPGFKQMEWLRIQLQFLRERGMKAMLMGHVPPARTDSKQLWDETCWQKYTLWLKQYRDVVIVGLYGHMNIDHFLLQDTKDIDLALLGAERDDEISIREAMEDELSIESTADYLQELRTKWSRLPSPSEMDSKEKRGNKKKGKPKAWSERYQLTLVSPSIVPNYFPTLRVIEYNISGLENAPVWVDAYDEDPRSATDDQKRLDLRDSSELFEEFEKKGKDEGEPKDGAEEDQKKKKKKGKKGKDKKPKDPNLVVPEPPAKSSPPGPAYSQQPLSLTGYTQYYANLTHINNDMTPDDSPKEEAGADSSWSDWLLRWRQGKHGGQRPKDKKPKPREFVFEVEYSTFEEKRYKLDDLTVNSFVELAYRLGQKSVKGKALVDGGLNNDADDEDEQDGVDEDEESENDSESEDEVAAEVEGSQKGKDGNKKKKKKKSKKKRNKTWLRFLRHAFVSTMDNDELKKFA